VSGPAWTEPGPVATALGTFVVSLADSKFFLGRRVAEWSVGAPELESAVACAAVAQEELGHARVLYPLLADLPLDPPLVPLEREQDRERYYCPRFLTRPWESWPEAVVGLALVDAAVQVALQSATSSAHGELARRACRIVDEERFHTVFAWGRLRALLATRAGEVRPLLASRLDEVVDWLGSLASPLGVLKAQGLVDADGRELVDRYVGTLRGQLPPSVPWPEVAAAGPAGP